MKIGIITIHKSPNYGASLQSFALWRYIENKGVDCEIIDLYRPFQKEYIPSNRFHLIRAQKKSLINSIKKNIRRILLIRNKTSQLYSDEAKRKFEHFNSLIKYSKSYYGIDELYADPPLYDLYISGSDQIWNPTQPYCMEPYFLTFVPKGRKKISYASSIGITELTAEEQIKYKKWLASYKGISVRENQAKILLESFIERNDISQVPDPTFLLDIKEWEKIAVYPNVKKPYLLLFILQWSQVLVDYAIKISKESGLHLIVLSQRYQDHNKNDYLQVTDAGPEDFLGYIADAEMVITDSFHCTVFSIIMSANNFYTYIAPYNKRGSRITDLLDTFQLSDHLLKDLNISYKDLQKKEIQREAILSIIKNIQNKGKNFIDKYLHE